VKWVGALHWTFGARAWWGACECLPDGRLFLRHERTWLRTPPEQAAKDILAAIRTLPRGDTLTMTLAQPALWPSDRKAPGTSLSEIFRRSGVALERGSDDRINGWAALRAWLTVRDFSPPGAAPGTAMFRSPALLVHPDCLRFIRTISTLVANEKDSEDVEPTTDEYPAAAMRRLVMSRPMPEPRVAQVMPPGAIGHEVAALRAASQASVWDF
jgi:hypothetical protein